MKFLKKYNNQINILFCIYAFLIIVFSTILWNIVRPKAYGNLGGAISTNFTASATYDGNSETANYSFDYSSGNHTGIFIKLSDEELEEAYSNDLGDRSIGSSYVFLTNPYNSGPTITRQSINGSIGISGPYYAGYDSIITRYINNKFGTDYIGAFSFIGFSGMNNNKPFNGTWTYSGDEALVYVDSIEDAKQYLIYHDESVTKTGDPNDNKPVDSQIPTPQKVAVYKESSSPSLVWSNPKGITNNDNIKVRIEWKPVIILTHGLYDVHSIITSDYELLYYDNIGDYNSFCTLNNNGSPPPNVLNSYNTIYDPKVLFSGTGAQQSNDWANYFILKNNVDWVTRVDPFGTNDLFGKGTYSGVRVPDLKYRIRYETSTGVSDWIYSDREFGSDNVSGPSQHSSTHSRNASGDPVSNPTYVPNNDNNVIPQNEVDDQEDSEKKKSSNIFDFIAGLFDTIIEAISTIFSKLKELVDSIQNGTGSFFSFFADMFGAFPQLLGIFLLGLVVTVLLRVLGR